MILKKGEKYLLRKMPKYLSDTNVIKITGRSSITSYIYFIFLPKSPEYSRNLREFLAFDPIPLPPLLEELL